MAGDHSLTILLIEDDPDSRTNLQDILEMDGHRVETAGSVAEALQRDDWSQLSVVVLDWKLPDGSAEVLLPKLRELAPEVAVIVSTGTIGMGGAVVALRHGAWDYIIKPIDVDMLRASLTRVIERRQTQEALRRTQEQFRLLVEGVRDYAIIMLDPRGRVVSWNAAAERIEGYTESEIVGQPIGVFYSADDVARGVPDEQLERAATEGNLRIEGWRIRKDGTQFWASVTLTALRDSDGRLRGFANVTHDVTDQKRAEDALRDREVRLRAILDAAADAIISIDERGTIESFNPSAERMFGYARSDVVGKNISMLMPSPYREMHDRYLEDYFRTGQRRIIGIGRELSGLHASGRVFPIDLSVSEVYVGDRRLFTGIIRDVTERKQAAEELRREHDFAQTLIETAQAIVLILDRDGRIKQFNRFMEELSGYSLAEVEGRDWFEMFLPEEDRAAIRECFQQAIQGIPPRGNINPIVTRSGTQRQIAWWGNPLQDADGQSIGVLSIGHDVTELREAQQRALQAERLAAIGEAMTGLAHESRNALQRSQASLEMLRRRIDDRPEALELLNRIQNAQDDLHQLYEEVREYAAPIRFNPRKSDLSEILREAWHHLEVRRVGRHTALHEAGETVGLECEVDPFALRQVFRNILENSLAASDDPVEIRVRYSAAELHGRPALRIAIRDNGPGLTPEARERIFDEFYTTKTHGTGLGMAICKRFILEHGGQIAVGREEGPGAEIFITLPRTPL